MKINTRIFEIGNLVMMYDSRYLRRAHQKLLSKWYGPYQFCFATNDTYFSGNLDRIENLDRVNHAKLKKIYVDLLS